MKRTKIQLQADREWVASELVKEAEDGFFKLAVKIGLFFATTASVTS